MPSVCTDTGFPQAALINANDAHLESIESIPTDERDRIIASADPGQIAQNRFTDGEKGPQHQLFLKDEQIRIKRIENKAYHDRR